MELLYTYLEESLLRSDCINRSINLMEPWLSKYSITVDHTLTKVEVDGKVKLGVIAKGKEGLGAIFLWKLGDTSQVESVAFTSDIQGAIDAWREEKEQMFDILVLVKGTNLIKLCELACKVLSKKIDMSMQSIREYLYDISQEDRLKELEREQRNTYGRLSYARKKALPTTGDLQSEYDDISRKIATSREGIFKKVFIKAIPDVKEIDKF